MLASGSIDTASAQAPLPEPVDGFVSITQLKMINGGLIANLTALSLAPRWGRQCRSMMHRPGIYQIPMKP
ncbi:MAG TPA: hypothetical protein DEA94_01615 [Rhodobacteraceae bacterium]|nr:hypothetical protein [Paracoccaceae bacterium]